MYEGKILKTGRLTLGADSYGRPMFYEETIDFRSSCEKGLDRMLAEIRNPSPFVNVRMRPPRYR